MERGKMEKKQDLRIIKTHKALYDTFSEMLSEKKFEDITVNELCERALVRRATFYKHFADKYEFFAFFVRNTRMQLTEKISEKLTDDDPNSYYLNIFEVFISFLNEHQDLVDTTTGSTAFPTLLNILSEEIQTDIYLHLKEQEKQGYTCPVALNILAAFYAGGIIKIVQEKLSSPKSISTETLLENYKAIITMFH